MRTRDLVVVGASAGGVEALRALVAELPADFPAALLVALHLPAGGTSTLAAILDRSGELPAKQAASGDAIEPGHVYVAPPDYHLLVEDGTLSLARGPAENGHRPAINALFHSAALAGPGVVGVVLSGSLDDGALGLASITRRGGVALVQDPEDALYSGMPEAALARVRAQAVLPIGELGKYLTELVREPIPEAKVEPPDAELRNEIALARDGDRKAGATVRHMGAETEFSCPDCGGGLVDVSRNGVSFRCHVGHGWTLHALHDTKNRHVENALWTALRTLEEKAALCERMEAGAESRGAVRLSRRHADDRRRAMDAAAVLRELVMGPTGEAGARAQDDQQAVPEPSEQPAG